MERRISWPWNGYKVNEDEDLETASHDVVMDSSCCMQTVPAGFVDTGVPHARSMPAHQPPHRQGERVGTDNNPGGRTTDSSETVTNEDGIDGSLPK